ncbi:LamG domain-containing protein [Candidatus Poribacteria bacterium]
MKRLFIVLAYLMFVSFSTAVLMADITTDLVAYWPLDNDARDSASDNHGTLEGGASMAADAKRGSVLNLDGVDGYVDIPDSADFDITVDFTVAFWIKLPETFDSSSATSMPPVGMFGSNDYQMLLTLVGAGYTSGIPAEMMPPQGSMVFKVEDKSAGLAMLYASTTTTLWEADTWYHVTGVYNDADVTGHIYVDGELQGSTRTQDSISALLKNVGGPIEIGRCQLEQIGGSVNYFHGRIDDVRIYSRALSEADIHELLAVLSVEPAVKLAITWGAIKR